MTQMHVDKEAIFYNQQTLLSFHKTVLLLVTTVLPVPWHRHRHSGYAYGYGVMPQLDFLVCYTNVGHSKFGYSHYRTF